MPVGDDFPDVSEEMRPQRRLAEPSARPTLQSAFFAPLSTAAGTNSRRSTVAHRSLLKRVAAVPRRFRESLPSMLSEEAAHGHGFLFVPVALGAGAAIWFSLPRDPPLVALVLVFAVLTAISFATRRRPGCARLLPAGFALCLAGMLLAHLETSRRSTVIIDSPVTTYVTGRVERLEPNGQGRWRYIVRILETRDPVLRRPPERVSLLARSRHEPIATGQMVEGRARLSPPSGPALPRLADFAFSSYFDGIGAVGFFYGAPKQGSAPSVGEGWLDEMERKLFDLRSEVASRIREAVPGDAGAFAAAIVTDERRAISEETTEALRVSGLAHIIAISGLNMALAAGIFFVGVRTVLGLFMGFAQTWPVKKIAAFGALMMATAYYLISGFAVSAERAYLMMAVMLVAVFFDRTAISLRNVALSALVIIAISPSEVMGPSFQMSFAATVALVAGYALWKGRAGERDPEPFPFRHSALAPALTAWNFVAGIFATSLIGGLSTAIYSVEHFHRLATYGLAANLAAMPLISFVVMPAGLLGMLLMPFGLEEPFLKVMGLGLEAVIGVAKHVAAWGGDVGIGRQHSWFLAVASAAFVILMLLRTGLRLAGLPILLAGLFLSFQERQSPPPDLLISEDGTTVALRTGDTLATNRTRPPDFIFSQWERALLLEKGLGPSMSPDGDAGKAALDQAEARRDLSSEEIAAGRERLRKMLEASEQDHFTCERKTWCAARSRAQAVIVAVEDARLTGAACDVATIVVAPRARLDRCRSGALLLNGQVLRRTGALEIRFNSGSDPASWNFRTAMIDNDRPWSRHRFYDWRSGNYDRTLPEPVTRLLSDNGE